jgi:cell division protein FtsW (lipid II flippase)
MDKRWNDALREPRTIGVASAVAATFLGIVYLVAAGAPARYLVVNLAALVLGLVALGGLDKAALQGRPSSGRAVALLGTALLATALFGASADGASRWIWIGPLSVQVSLVVLPFMLVSFAGHRDWTGTAGIALAAIALAVQPDRAMAGMLALGLAALATARRDVFSVTALLAAVAAFGATLVRPDHLPAVAFVDRVLFTAFSAHPLAGAAALLGVCLLVLPAVAGRWQDPAHDCAYRVFGALWIGGIAAAALGNYPTPVVGYGGSAILGYVLSLSVFPPRIAAGESSIAERTGGDDIQADPMQRRAGPALGH